MMYQAVQSDRLGSVSERLFHGRVASNQGFTRSYEVTLNGLVDMEKHILSMYNSYNMR